MLRRYSVAEEMGELRQLISVLLLEIRRDSGEPRVDHVGMVPQALGDGTKGGPRRRRETFSGRRRVSFIMAPPNHPAFSLAPTQPIRDQTAIGTNNCRVPGRTRGQAGADRARPDQ